MAHIRIARHYIHTPIVLMSVSEFVLIVCAAYFGYWLRFGVVPGIEYLIPGVTFGLFLVICMIAMGVYEARIREGYAAMMLRTGVAIFLLGSVATAVLSYALPGMAIGRGVLLLSGVAAFVFVAIWRWLMSGVLTEESLKRRVLVLGTGHRASKIASRMRRRSDQRAFQLVGFLELAGHPGANEVAQFGANVLHTDLPLDEFCRERDVQEVVVAMDERRRNQDASGGIPLDELMECRLSGINVCDVQQFIEREAGKIDVDLLRPSWMVFSDGFITTSWRAFTKRTFDLLASSFLLLLAWPFMLLTALFVWIEGRFRDPIFYKQERVGLDGKPFRVIKFRSMRTDAEKDGKAVWASQNDPRITRVGAFIRKTRLDELPQLLNVFRGDMSFVGPRPERPVFVEELNGKLPYYAQRHRVKPGITGWAQLCYPYGASVDDAKEKLQYDLYYLKNNSLLLDLIILLQTVEVVLVGDGAR
ncbi:MAG: TIGR03013 family PEP-CTERM/XrtA system glycosyltransferase [Pseudomonadales bacterium]